MPNQYVNIVQLSNGDTLIDLSNDDVTEGDVTSGVYFHKANGSRSVGTRTAPNYVLGYGDNTVGNAVVGTAVTEDANYTPSGDIVLQTSGTNVVVNAVFDYEYDGSVLKIKPIKLTPSTIQIPTGATFTGSGVTFTIEEDNS